MVSVPGTVVIRDLREEERAWADARYREIRFAVTPPTSIALVAERADLGGARVGLGRLVAHAPDVRELGGIWTHEGSRGLGVARAMVAALLARHERGDHVGPLWCIPFVHLVAFYRSCGFAVSAPPWPPAIAAKVAACVAQALPEVVVLAR